MYIHVTRIFYVVRTLRQYYYWMDFYGDSTPGTMRNQCKQAAVHNEEHTIDNSPLVPLRAISPALAQRLVVTRNMHRLSAAVSFAARIHVYQ